MKPAVGMKVILNTSVVMGEFAGVIVQVAPFGAEVEVSIGAAYEPFKAHFFETKPATNVKYWNRCWIDPRYQK